MGRGRDRLPFESRSSLPIPTGHTPSGYSKDHFARDGRLSPRGNGRGAGARQSIDPQTQLLAEFGRSRVAEATRTTIARFGSAFDRGDVNAVMATMTTDCVFESTAPPDGYRHEGQEAVRRAWTDFFAASHGAVFETEELIVSDDRAIVRWRYTWAPGTDGHVRGIDLFRVQHGKVAKKLSYVKG